MSITERDRADLYDGLEQTLGPNAAQTLMSMLPERPSNELVTTTVLQSEMAAFRGEITAQFAEFRGDVRTDMADFRSEIRGDMAELRTELKGDMAELRTELKGDIGSLRTEVKGDIARLGNDMGELRTEVKGDVLRVENSLSLRIADLQTSMNRWAVGLTAANVIGMVTALAT